LAVKARFSILNIDYLDAEEELNTLLEVAKLFKKDFENLKPILEQILNFVVHPIRNKIEELKNTQDLNTSESLKILAEKNITLDILIRWIKTVNSVDDITKSLKNHMKITEEQLSVLPNDIQTIFKNLK
jgi:hypothetical protein